MTSATPALQAFEAIVGGFDYPMLVVTVANGDERAGCLVGFATQASIDPARYLVCISKQNHTYEVAREAPSLCVHALRNTDRPLAELFGGQTGHLTDKFTECSWRGGPEGAPVIDGCSWFAGRVLTRADVGDHMVFLLEPYDGQVRPGGPQLGFQSVRDLEPGHEA